MLQLRSLWADPLHFLRRFRFHLGLMCLLGGFSRGSKPFFFLAPINNGEVPTYRELLGTIFF